MNTIVNFKTDKKIKDQAKKIAEEMGLTISDILNIYLRNFIKHKVIYLNLDQDESNPTDELLASVKEAEEDYKKGVLKSYDDIESAIEHLRKL